MNETTIEYFLIHGEDTVKIGELRNGKFTINTYPEKGINSLDEWIVLFIDRKSKIYNAGGFKLSAGRMIDLIQEYSV